MKRTCLAIGLIATMFLAFACERRGTGGASETGPIKVGIYGDLSGRTASFGQSSANGAKMAADEISKAGGILGRQIEIFNEDDQGRPEQAATVVTKLINQDKVHALIGEVASGNTLAAAPIAQQAAVPMITPSSTNPAVTEVGDYIFRVCFIDPFQGEVMARFAVNTLKAKTAAILSDFNAPYSIGLTKFFKENFTKLGGTIVLEQAYTQGDGTYTGQLTSIRAQKPDVIYVPGYYSEVGVIAKQAKQLGVTSTLLGGDGWDSPKLWELGGAALNGAYMSNHYSVDDPSPAIQKFVADYKARYGNVPDALAALGYDAMKVLAHAIETAGTTQGAKLRDAIAHTTAFKGVTGSITINAERNAVKPAVVLELQDNKLVYKETIQPGGAEARSNPEGEARAESLAIAAAARVRPIPEDKARVVSQVRSVSQAIAAAARVRPTPEDKARVVSQVRAVSQAIAAASRVRPTPEDKARVVSQVRSVSQAIAAAARVRPTPEDKARVVSQVRAVSQAIAAAARVRQQR